MGFLVTPPIPRLQRHIQAFCFELVPATCMRTEVSPRIGPSFRPPHEATKRSEVFDVKLEPCEACPHLELLRCAGLMPARRLPRLNGSRQMTVDFVMIQPRAPWKMKCCGSGAETCLPVLVRLQYRMRRPPQIHHNHIACESLKCVWLRAGDKPPATGQASKAVSTAACSCRQHNRLPLLLPGRT